MLPEIVFLLKVLLVLAIGYGLWLWLGMVFQNILFQKYRLYKNEAAHRKTRLHEEAQSAKKYRSELLGEVVDSEEGQDS
ncbi:MAG: hypothetical protein HQL32_02395 [Planctomycetes bacterium]|nr:hypothetical protein [Planctomycetota bacterium]